MKKNRKLRIKLSCKQCEKPFEVIPSRVGRAKYCSQQCSLYGSIGKRGYWDGRKRPKPKMGNAIKTMFKKGLIPWNKGKGGTYKVTISESRFGHIPWNKGISTPETGLSGENHPMWKGGKPRCKDCNKLLSRYVSKRCLSCANTGELSPAWRGGITPELKKIRQSKEFAEWRTSVFKRDDYTCQMCGQIGKILHPHHIKEFAYYPESRFDLNNGQTLCVECHKQTPSYCRQTLTMKKGGVAHELQSV
jgi:hypothetical protein